MGCFSDDIGESPTNSVVSYGLFSDDIENHRRIRLFPMGCFSDEIEDHRRNSFVSYGDKSPTDRMVSDVDGVTDSGCLRRLSCRAGWAAGAQVLPAVRRLLFRHLHCPGIAAVPGTVRAMLLTADWASVVRAQGKHRVGAGA
jgi:hypothetical protein